MKTFVRIGSLVIALGVAGLMAGCASSSSTQSTQRSRVANDFEVVETSTKRTLTPKEMAQLRVAVAKYLEKEGATDSGDYYVKVFLSPDKDGVPADWVVVRFTRDTELRFSLLASYPAYYDRSYASYDYYPYGYDNFGRISFQYYDDPFYGSRYHYPRGYNHGRPRHRDHDGNHPDHPRPPEGQPENPTPGEPPRVTRTRWDSNPADRANPHRENNFPHRSAPPTSQAARPPESRASQPLRTSTNTEPLRTSSQASPRSESSRSESSPARSNNPSPPASRVESSQRSNSEQSQSPREAFRAATQREKLE